MRKGTKHSKITRKKISESHKGKKHTPETKDKIGKSHIGKHHTEKTKQTLSENHKGKYSGCKNPNYGKHWSEEIRKKMSEGNKGKHKGINLGSYCSEKHKIKISEANKGKNNGMYGKSSPKSGIGHGSYYISPLQDKIWLRSTYELAYAKWLDSQKILWYYEIETFELSDEMTYTPDFFLPRYDKFVEIKGYMRKEAQEKIDKFKNEYPWNLEVLYKEDLIKLGINL